MARKSWGSPYATPWVNPGRMLSLAIRTRMSPMFLVRSYPSWGVVWWREGWKDEGKADLTAHAEATNFACRARKLKAQ